MDDRKPPQRVDSVNLVDTIRHWAELRPDAIALTHLPDGERPDLELSYGQLAARIDAVAEAILKCSSPGARALLCISNELEYLVALLACFEAGIIGIPSLVPVNARAVTRIESHMVDADASLVLVDTQSAQYLESKGFSGRLTQIDRLQTDKLEATGSRSTGSGRTRHPVAYLQYTSGSTMNPRGVVVSHANLCAQREMLAMKLHQAPGAVYVNWMPLFHDFGLVMSMQAFETGGRCIMLPPARVVQQPLRWLSAMARFGAAISAGATFMFDLCTRKISGEQLAGLDLRHWRHAVIAAEPIQAEIVDRFVSKFSAAGFHAGTMTPAYGMAEATLLISSMGGDEPVVVGFDEAALRNGHAVEDRAGRPLVSSGRPCFPDSVRIVDPQTRQPCLDGVVGELWASNPCVGMGYWGHESTGDSPFAGLLAGEEGKHFLRTGDLAFIREQEVFIVGRSKDVIIINGENRYPQDLEWTINGCHPALEAGAGVVVGFDVDGLERVAVVHEVKRSARHDLDAMSVVSAIRACLAADHGIDVHAVHLLTPAGLPKTSSGKVQRQATKKLMLSSQLPVLSVWRKDEAGEPVRGDVGGSVLARCRARLQLPNLGADDNLFALGLDSLKAMELIADLEGDFQRVVDPSAFAEAPTARGLASLLTSTIPEAAGQTPIVANASDAPWPFGRLGDAQIHDLQAYVSAWHGEWVSPNRLIFGMNLRGSKPPLFWCFQGHAELTQLAQHLGPDQPLYGLRSAHLVADYKSRRDISALAAFYLEEIRRYVPQPDYFLGGNCQGGLLMTRVALLMHALGEPVRHVFILESIDPGINASVLPFGVSMFFGRRSHEINPFLRFPTPTGTWDALFPAGYTLDFINCGHGEYFSDPNVADLARKLASRLRSKASLVGRPLSDDAMRARIEGEIPGRVLAQSTHSIVLSITNVSSMAWTPGPFNSLILANHWLGETGQPLTWLDGYTPLEEVLESGANRQVMVQIVAPTIPGKYVLEFDLANQGIAWFNDKGGSSFRRTVIVETTGLGDGNEEASSMGYGR